MKKFSFLILVCVLPLMAQLRPPRRVPAQVEWRGKIGDAISLPLLPRMDGATACTFHPTVAFEPPGAENLTVQNNTITGKATDPGLHFFIVRCTLNGKLASQLLRIRVWSGTRPNPKPKTETKSPPPADHSAEGAIQ